MAFKFFRQRQKLVLIIMVFLMIVFLIPSGIRGLFAGRHKVVIGNIGKEEITLNLVRLSEQDLRIIRREQSLAPSPWPWQNVFQIFYTISNEDKLPLTWTLLVHEAKKMGITVSDAQVRAFLKKQKLEGQVYKDELANLSQLGLTEKDLYRAVRHYMMVMATFDSAAVNVPPSLPELKHIFRDLYERINLSMLAFAADDFIADAPEPDEQTIREWFERYKNLLPNHPSNKTDFGFGYRRPDRIDIAWLFIDSDKVYAAIEPSDKQMLSYWRRHKGEIKKLVPIKATTTKPSTQPKSSPTTTATTTPSTKPNNAPRFREVVITRYSEAKPQIYQILKQQGTEIKISELIALLQKRLAKFSKQVNPYPAVVKSMHKPADELLNRRISMMPFTSAKLKTVIDQLGQIARVKIVYPIGKYEKFTIDGEVSIQTSGWKNITLAKALELIGNQIGLPSFKWVCCDGFPDVIFPLEPINLFPISSGRSGLVSFEEIAKDEILGHSYIKSQYPSKPGGDIISIASTAKVFPSRRPNQVPLIEIGADYGLAMYVIDHKRGRLLWRLIDAQPSHTPEQLTADIRREVIRDIKIVHGFKKALKTAKELAAKINKGETTLEKIANSYKKSILNTGFFSRKRFDSAFERIVWSYVPEVGVNVHFIEKAFSLVPDDPDKPATDKPATVVELYRQHKVMLIQRIGYEPAKKEDFDQVGASLVASLTMMTRWREQVFQWFLAENVAKRVGFIPRFAQ